jgi:hypothetical protein
MNLTTVRRQDGRVALWAYSRSNVLNNNIQRVAGGENWAGWDRGGTWQENFGIIAEIENTLARDIDPKDHKPSNKDVTYLRTSGNKFTRLDTPRHPHFRPLSPGLPGRGFSLFDERRMRSCRE